MYINAFFMQKIIPNRNSGRLETAYFGHDKTAGCEQKKAAIYKRLPKKFKEGLS